MRYYSKIRKLFESNDDLNQEESYVYPEAGKNAQPGVKSDVETWRSLPVEERENQPLLYWLLGDGTPPYKMSQEDAQYIDQSHSENHTCGKCEFIYQSLAHDSYICSQIRNPIQIGGHCKLWTPVE